METNEVSVLVVGAGPAGLATAATLADHGVDCLVVDRRQTPSAHPRATVISTRTMELVRAWGLEAAVLAGGVDVEWLMWCCETLAGAADGVGVEIGLTSPAQAALVSPSAPACVPQDHLEAVLRRHVAAQPTARIELATELVALQQDADGVRATLRTAAGAPREVRAAFVVAADGAYSPVRGALGIAMEGPDEVLGGVTALIRAPLWELLGDRRFGIYVTERPGLGGVVLPAGPGDRWRVGFLAEPAAGRPQAPDVDETTALIRCAAGVPDLPVRVDSVGAFTSAAQLADRFRQGRVFLVGDAAHRVTPRGGTGMNTAVHDGADLGWKLGWVLRGWAGADLLDTYERERRPVASHNVARSADPNGSRRSPGEELRLDLGGRIAHHWVVTPSGPESTLDLLGPGLTLLTGPDGGGWETAARAVAGPSVAHHVLDAVTARALGAGPGGALLARPDGVPVALWPRSVAEPDRALRAAVAGVAPTASPAMAAAA